MSIQGFYNKSHCYDLIYIMLYLRSEGRDYSMSNFKEVIQEIGKTRLQ